MKPRARRVTLAASVLGAGVIALLVVLHWSSVCDHVEAWRFQLSGETVTVVADPVWHALPFDARAGFRKPTTEDIDSIWGGEMPVGDQEEVIGEFDAFFHILANTSGCPVIYSRGDAAWDDMTYRMPVSWLKSATAGDALEALGFLDWRVLDQRFPRRAFIIVEDDRPAPLVTEQTEPARRRSFACGIKEEPAGAPSE